MSEDTLNALYSLAYQHYQNGRYEIAQPLFLSLTHLDPRGRRYWMALGACYQVKKEYELALQCYMAAALLECKEPLVHTYAAQCLYELGKSEEADSALQEAKKWAKNHKILLDQLSLLERSAHARR